MPKNPTRTIPTEEIQTVTPRWRAVEIINVVLGYHFASSLMSETTTRSTDTRNAFLALVMCLVMVGWKMFDRLPSPSTHSEFICTRVAFQRLTAGVIPLIVALMSTLSIIAGYNSLNCAVWLAERGIAASFFATISTFQLAWWLSGAAFLANEKVSQLLHGTTD